MMSMESINSNQSNNGVHRDDDYRKRILQSSCYIHLFFNFFWKNNYLSQMNWKLIDIFLCSLLFAYFFNFFFRYIHDLFWLNQHDEIPYTSQLFIGKITVLITTTTTTTVRIPGMYNTLIYLLYSHIIYISKFSKLKIFDF